MTIMTTGNFAKLMSPGINKVYDEEQKKNINEYLYWFDVQNSERAYEEDQEIVGSGLAGIKPEGNSINYATMSQGYKTRYNQVTVAQGMIFTMEEIKYNLYLKGIKSKTPYLQNALYQTKEYIAANLFINNAFDTNYPIGDGAALVSTSHPTSSGLQSNLLSTASNLSQAAIEDLVTQIENSKSSAGHVNPLKSMSLHVGTANMWEAYRILGSTLQSDTAENAVNVIKSQGVFPNGVKVHHYQTDTNAWSIKTNAMDGFKMFVTMAPTLFEDKDGDTLNVKLAYVEMYSVGCSNWRAIYATPGAS